MRLALLIYWLAVAGLTMGRATAIDDTVAIESSLTTIESRAADARMVQAMPAEKGTSPRARRWESADETVDIGAMRGAPAISRTRNDVRSRELFDHDRLASTMLLLEQAAKFNCGVEGWARNAEVRFGAELHSLRERQSDP